jgi:hypothetical protein
LLSGVKVKKKMATVLPASSDFSYAEHSMIQPQRIEQGYIWASVDTM